MKKHDGAFIKGVTFSYLYIAVYLITGILTTPLLLNHFGSDYFALLMIIYAIVTYLNNIRLGLPESLAAFMAKNKDKIFNTLMIKKSFYLLGIIVFSFLVLFYFIGLIIDDWRVVLGDVYSLDKNIIIDVFYILIVFAVLRIPLDMAQSIFVGFHDVYLEKVYKLLNPLVNFILVLFVVYTGKSVLFFAIWAGFFDFLVSLVSLFHAMKRYSILNCLSDIPNKDISSKELIKSGFLFFQLTLTQSIIWGIGIFFVSHILTLNDVTIYSLTMKVYIYIFYAFIIINSVVAPLYGKYYSNSNWQEIQKVFNLLIHFLPFLGGFIWIGTLYFMEDIIYLWTGSKNFFIGSFFIFFMGIFFYFMGYVNSYITLLYSIGKVKDILYIRWKEVALNIVLTILFIYMFGLVGVAMGVAISLILTSVKVMPKIINSVTENEIKVNYNIQKEHFIYILIPNVIFAIIVLMYMDSILVKSICFFISSAIYLILSWSVLRSKDKDDIISLLNCKKVTIES